jgi:hypothetical protein
MQEGPEAEGKIGLLGHAQMEKRNSLAVDTRLTLATGRAGRGAVPAMVQKRAGAQR